MESQGFQQILSDYFIPFVNQNYPYSHRLMMDNDPKHTSRSTASFMRDSGINHW